MATIVRLACAGLTLVLMVRAGGAAPAEDPVAPRSETGETQSRMARFLGDRPAVGFYIYLYNWKQAKDPNVRDLDEALAEMAKRGFTYLYVGGVSDGELWRRVLDLAADYRMAVVPQLDFAYLQSPSDNVAALVARAAPFIRKYKDNPAVAGFSVREEPSAELMPAMRKYFEGILAEVPDAPLHLLHNNLPALQRSEPPYPGIIGVDRYPFWWEFGSGGHRATPRYALNWYRTQLDRYCQLAVQRKAEFQAVFTASTLETIIAPEDARKAFYPATITPDFREKAYQHLKQLAATRNQGWNSGPQDMLRYWKYYRPPGNCVRAMAWLAVMEGARSQAVWAWSPPREDMKGFAHRENGKTKREYVCGITGWDGKGTPQLEEYTSFVKEIRPYGRLIRAMSKEYAPAPAPGKGGGPAAPPEAAVFAVTGDEVFWRSFRVDGYAGRVILVVNTAVGAWCEGRSPGFLSPSDTFRIDDWGNLVDYKPFDKPREVKCRIAADGMDCVDLQTGESLRAGDDASLSLSIMPGGGRFLFVCPKGSQEAGRLKRQFGL